MIISTLSLLGCLTLLAAPPEEKKEERKPRFTVGKSTTYVDGPLDKDGRIDYAAALNKRLGKGVTPQNNANVLLWQAMGPKPEGGAAMPMEFFKLQGIEPPSEKGEYFTDFERFYRALHGVPPDQPLDQIDAILDRAMSRPWTSAAQPDIALWLKGNAKPLSLVIEATKRPRYFSPLIGRPMLLEAPLPGVQKCRALAKALVIQAMQYMGNGDLDAAWVNLMACHRLAAFVARGGTTIEYLVGVVIDKFGCNADLVFLDQIKADSKRLELCQRDLQALHSAFPAFADSCDLAERFMILDVIMMTDRRGLKVLEMLAGGDGRELPLQKQVEDLIDWDPALESANQWHDRLSAALRERDRPTRIRKLSDIDGDLKALKEKTVIAAKANIGPLLLAGQQSGKAIGKIFGDIVVGLMLTSTKVAKSEDRAIQCRDNVSLGFALARYRLDHGSYPKELSSLAPKYLKEVPKDLFSGKPLIYRPEGNGYLLYSVGINGKDDGGHGPDDTPKGDDLSVRMPLPELPKK